MTTQSADITFFGTGEFAARALFDLVASASQPLTVQVVGRNEARLAWLRTAANARAVLFGRPVRTVTRVCDSFEDEPIARILSESRPRVVFQAASLQTASVLRGTDNAWSQLVQQGGLSATAPFQALLSLRIARIAQRVLPGTHFLNACFPDVVNPMLAAAGANVLCGVGNIGILSNSFAGSKNVQEDGRLRVLAHYQQLGVWRRQPGERQGATPRVWLDGREVADVFGEFADVKLSPEVAFDISGATGVPLMMALALGKEWRGHVPGPLGLPGGYPVRIDAQGRIALDLPEGITAQEAERWNNAFEERSGLTVSTDGRACYHGLLREKLELHDPELAKGFHCTEVEAVAERLGALRDRLQSVQLSV
ncbi:hypothetical protein [Ottowia thiooxydans]|uniref:hypothetical protein n=1 Tax=Ottowia thiooxydans TaxID=219182 RepID=UPI00041B0241|nr:hypothetical protein [Ottowia thiooxydans]